MGFEHIDPTEPLIGAHIGDGSDTMSGSVDGDMNPELPTVLGPIGNTDRHHDGAMDAQDISDSTPITVKAARRLIAAMESDPTFTSKPPSVIRTREGGQRTLHVRGTGLKHILNEINKPNPNPKPIK